MNGSEQPSALKPDKAPFWIRIFYAPFNLRSEMIVFHIGSTIGEFMEWENKGEEKWGSFLRIRVLVDMDKPLKKGTTLKDKEGSSFNFSSSMNACLTSAIIVGKLAIF